MISPLNYAIYNYNNIYNPYQNYLNTYDYRNFNDAIPSVDFYNYVYRGIPSLKTPVDNAVTMHQYNRNHDLNYSGVPDWRETSINPIHSNIYDSRFRNPFNPMIIDLMVQEIKIII